MSALIALISMTDYYPGGLLSRDMKGHQLLLPGRKDADPNRHENDRTPLGCAAMNRQEGVVKLYKLGSLTVAKTGTSVVAPVLPVKQGFAPSRCREEGGADGGGKALNRNPVRARMNLALGR